MLTALIRKDLRLLTPVAIAGTVLFLTPLIVALLTAAISPDPAEVTIVGFLDGLPYLLLAGSATAAMVTPAVFASLGARERRDGSAAMITLLGAPRSKVVVSRAVVGLFAALSPWLIGAATASLAMLVWRGPSGLLEVYRGVFQLLYVGSVTTPGSVTVPTQNLQLIVCLLLALGGLGWMFGSILRSEVLATLLPVFLTMVAMLGVGAALYQINARHPGRRTEDDFQIYIEVLLILGLASSALGTLVAIKRRTP